MRVKHILWKVSNGWLLVPEECAERLSYEDAPQVTVFKSLKEFSDWTPKRQRRKSKKDSSEPKHTLD
jgi:hypothetical protein